MLPSVCRLYRRERLLAACYRNAGLSKSPTSARSARVRPPHAVMLLCLHALWPSCPRTLMFSWIHALVLSHCDAFSLSSPRALVKEQLGNASFYYFMCVIVSSALSPSQLFSIPRESIRSLSNSLPVLARTGFWRGSF